MFERHLEMLRLVAADEPVGIVQLSNDTGYPHHEVRYSLRVLEDEGLITPTANGAETTDAALEFLDDVEATLDDLGDRVEYLRSSYVETGADRHAEE